MRILLSAIIGLIFMCMGNAEEAGISHADSISNVLKSNFERHHLAPIIIPRGEKVGDIIDTKNISLIARAEDCFPGLKPRKVNGDIPQIELSSEDELAAALGIRVSSAFEASGGTGKKNSYHILMHFTDVRVERASHKQLREKLKRNVPECDTVRQFLDMKSAVIANQIPPLIIGEVIYAKRVISITSSDKSDIKASGLLEAMMTRLGLGSQFSVSYQDKSKSYDEVSLIGNESLPIAFVPAMVVNSIMHAENGKFRYSIASTNYDQINRQIIASNEVRKAQEETQLAENIYFSTEKTLMNLQNALASFGYASAKQSKAEAAEAKKTLEEAVARIKRINREVKHSPLLATRDQAYVGAIIGDTDRRI